MNILVDNNAETMRKYYILCECYGNLLFTCICKPNQAFTGIIMINSKGELVGRCRIEFIDWTIPFTEVKMAIAAKEQIGFTR